MERITLTTKDGLNIVGNWSAPESAKSSVLLLHMWPATKESWTPFQALLDERGIASLAIDLRGHGESGGEQKQDASEMQQDVDAALAWMGDKGTPPHGIAGASIGANLALRAMAKNPELIAGVLLSPGLTYHGVPTLDAVEKLKDTQSLFFMASEGDDQESADAVYMLMKHARIQDKNSELLQNAGHGTNMFESHPKTMVMCANWMADIVNDL
ncbi:alpha/beta fold hydrolase [Candidatus Uhrbacteria bacterium]|nr:alpha/beta fold hydrolase [Candidatus Uhrbacteria bacterium]